MFPKLPTHLRPFLGRIPTASPDLFTPNPSLLHHLPQNGSSSHGLVSQAQTQASAQGAGRNGPGQGGGYGGGSAGSGGGYTGHARAFTSLSQTSADPSSGIRDDDNANSGSKNRRKRRQSISFKPPYHRPITVVEEPTSLASRLRLISSSGAGMKAVEIEELKELRTIPSTRTAISARERPNALGRSRSTLDLYAHTVGMPRSPGPVLAIRPYSNSPVISSAALASDLDLELGIDDRAPTPAPRRISQPNRVLMDLAGLDLPVSRARGQARGYATSSPVVLNASAHATTPASVSATDESIAYPPTASNESDRRIYSAIHHASSEFRRDFVTSLIQHYRSPRDLPSPHPELEGPLPRPEGWTVGTYNICMSSLLSVRKDGESIAELLEIYNEMLERDVLPNGRTYVNVIRALCLREKDVQSAVTQYEEERKWAEFKATSLGQDQRSSSASGSGAIDGYLSEGNFESACNLFIGIKNIQTASAPDGFYRFLPPVYSYLLDSIASQVHPSSKAHSQAMEIFNHASETDTASHRSLYRHLFRLLSTLKDGSGVSSLWERFEQERVGGAGAKLREWKDVLPGSEVEERELQVEGFQREVWLSAIRAFISTGNTSKGMELLGKMEERVGTNQKSTLLLEAPRIKSDQYPTIAIALAQVGEYELSRQVYGKAGGKVRPLDIGLYTDALVLGGKWDMALDTYLSFLSTRPEEIRPDVTRIKRIYTSILAHAISLKEYSMLENVERLMATGTYLLDTDLAIAHIKLLLSHGAFGSIAGVMDNFGPLQTKLDPEDRGRLNGLMQDIASTEIGLKEMLDITKAFSRQRTNIMLEQQDLVRRIIDEYLSAGKSVTSTLEPRHWSALLSTFSRTVGKGLNEGEYDHALESFIHDLKTYAPKTLEKDLEGRYTKAIGERLFNRFGSEKAIELLTPLIGVKADELIGSFFTPSTPELHPSSHNSGTSVNSDTPLTPPPTTSTLRIDESLSRRIDSHQSRPDGKPHITPQRAYDDLLTALSRPTPSAPSPESLSRLMVSLAREGDQPRVLELYDLAQRIIPTLPTRRQSSAWRAIEDSTLISQCHLGNLETAGLHRHRLVERGMGPSADAYATMIACSRDTTDDAQVARELWEESQAMGVVPHLYLYNTVISKLSKARKAEVALEMFAQMKERGVRPSSVTYGAVINACCRVGDAESAETLFNEMSSQPNFRPRVPPYNTMMQFYLQTRPSRERVLYYYSALRSSGVPPSAHTYKLLLDTYHTLSPLDLTSMERTFAELCADRSTKLQVQGTHWASLITAYGISAGDVPKALEVFDVIPTHPANRGMKPLSEPVVWEAILNVLATKGSLEEMEGMRKKMEGSNARPTAYVYNVLIQGYARHGKIEIAREIFESMADTPSGHSAPNNHPLPNSTNSGLETRGQVYREPSTYEAMIKAELSNSNPSGAEAVLRRMEERRYPVAVYMKVRALVDGAAIGAGAGAGAGGMGMGMRGGFTPMPVDLGQGMGAQG